LENIIAVAMADAVLVARKDKAQYVKAVMELLRDEKIPQAEVFPKDHRPWGWFESLILNKLFQVKRIYVKPRLH
jgi:mannose-1-phosphate guanylyltransferase / mannose-6-phosphate isomerase